MSWQILVTIGILCSSVLFLAQKKLCNKETTDPIAYAGVFQVSAGLAALIPAAIYHSHFDWVGSVLPQLIMMVVFYSLANIFWFRGLKKCEVSTSSILLSTRTIWATLGLVLILGNTISLVQFTGIFCLILAIFFVQLNNGPIKKQSGNLFVLIAALFYGAAATTDVYILKNADTLAYTSLAFLLPGLMVFFLVPRAIGQAKYIVRGDSLKQLLSAVILITIGTISVYSAYQSGGNNAIIYSLTQLSIVLSVILGILILKERKGMIYKIAGIVIAFIGLILVRL